MAYLVYCHNLYIVSLGLLCVARKKSIRDMYKDWLSEGVVAPYTAFMIDFCVHLGDQGKSGDRTFDRKGTRYFTTSLDTLERDLGDDAILHFRTRGELFGYVSSLRNEEEVVLLSTRQASYSSLRTGLCALVELYARRFQRVGQLNADMNAA